MTDLNLRAARIQLRSLIAALAVAIAIAVGITSGAFVLSFAVQRDLALQAGVPHHLTWIFPSIVDGAILGATIATVALSKINGSAAGKKFFLTLAVSVVLISVYGNAYHAHRAGEDAARKLAAGIDLGYTPLTPTGAALLAIIPPLLVLAFTHGVGILIKSIGTAYTEYNALVQAANVTAEVARNELSNELEEQGIEMNRQAWEAFRSFQANPVAPDVSSASAVAAGPVAEAGDPAQRGTAAGDASVPVGNQVDTTPATVAVVAEPLVADAPRVAAVADLGERSVARNAPSEASPEVYVLPDGEQTIENLLDFIDACDDFDPTVKETARLRITENLSYAEIATITQAKAASTAMRRYDKVAQRAVQAGFRTPPLPEVDDATDTRNAATTGQQYALVGAR
ncbi:DUF2637 domain-containing protein [Rhodococcus sp. MSC1_016]|jgi:hypothetical protein|uniref:DUF2637 domain-containing protein n=1 Tax=Rhodococcus sp. MSC1_016 TaxID=2909266 RepID=UPI00202EB635|nr:DUF2637 domain-containing protein [Rhodococcus sp. MSC1_016]